MNHRVSTLGLAGALAMVLTLGGAAHADAASFGDHFVEGATLRVDYFHTGTFGVEEINLDALIREGPWAGSRTVLLDPTEGGKHLVTVMRVGRDGTETPLYSRGFSSLFAEWQTTGEAKKGLRRAFHETVRVPFPRRPVQIVLSTRGANGVFQEISRFDVDPGSYLIVPPRLSPGAFPTVTLQEVGPTETAVDVLILGEGYTAAEMEKYHRDLRRFARALFETSPFRERQDAINLRALDLVSAETGMDEPRKGIYRDTALHVAFDTFGSARYLTTLENRNMRDIAGTAAYDTIFIMVNTSRYGGAGVYGLFSIFPSDNEYDEYVMVHEFGHGFAGLGDEYYSSAVAYEEFYPAGVEPWEPNITALLDPENPRWADLITEGTPCPTPPDPVAHGDGQIGCFEGAGYQPKGLYRPALDCKMFSKGVAPFCAVCARALDEMIDRYTAP